MLPKTAIEKRLNEYLKGRFGETVSSASNTQLYYALAEVASSVMLEKKAKEKFLSFGYKNIEISISQTRHFATAICFNCGALNASVK